MLINQNGKTTGEQPAWNSTQLQALLQSIPGVVLRFDETGRCVAYKSAPLAGWPSQNFKNCTLQDIVPAPAAELYWQAIGRVLGTGHPQTLKFQRDKHTYEAHFSACPPGEVICLVRPAPPQSDDYYKTVVENQTEIICCADPKTNTLTFVNTAYCEFFNEAIEDVVGYSFVSRIATEDQQAVLDHLATLSPDNPVGIIEHRIVKSRRKLPQPINRPVYDRQGQYVGLTQATQPNHEIRWLQWTNKAIFDDQGTMLEIHSVGRDITPYKQTEQALRDVEQQFRRTFQNSLLTISVTTLTGGRFIMVSDHFLELTEYNRDEIIGQRSLDLNLSIMPIERLDLVRMLREQGSVSNLEVQYRTKSGKIRDAIATFELINLDGRACILATGIDTTAWKASERTLRQERNLLHTLINYLPDYIYSKDANCCYMLSNKAHSEFLGVNSVAALEGKTDFDFFPPDLAAAFYDDDMSIIRSGKPIIGRHERMVNKSSGAELWVSTTKVPIRDAHGTIVGLVGLTRDITAQRQAAEALRQSEQQFRAIFENTAIGMAIINLDGRIDRCNAALEKLLAYEAKALCQLSLYALTHPDDANAMHAYLQQRFEANQLAETQLEAQLRRSDGAHMWGRLTTSLIDTEGELAIVLIEDITERKWANEALAHTKERYRALFENSPVGVMVVDLEQAPPAIIQVNRTATNLYQWPAATLTTLPLPLVFPSYAYDALAQVVDAMMLGEKITLETQQLRADTTTFPARLTATPDPELRFNQMIMIVDDITVEQTRRSEHDAIVEERQRIAQEIHDGIAQNLASLRMQVSFWHHLVEQNPPEMHAKLDYLRDFLRQNIQEVRRSIFALRPLSLEELGFFPALDRLIADFENQHHITVEFKVFGTRQAIPKALDLALFRIIQEGLNNISKHAQAKTVGLEIDFGLTEKIALTIWDDGRGFNPMLLHPTSQHLGLKQMRERVEKLNGVFRCDSEAGNGTRIQVQLPKSGGKDKD